MSSPSVVQKRREQNRIAQRNHRLKVKGKLAEQQEEPGPELSSQPPPHEVVSGMALPATTLGAPATGIVTPWLNYDYHQQGPPSFPPPGPEGDVMMFDQDFGKFPYQCNCSSFAGPCEFHREMIKAEHNHPISLGGPFDNFMDPSLSLDERPGIHPHQSSAESDMSGGLFRSSTTSTMHSDSTHSTSTTASTVPSSVDRGGHQRTGSSSPTPEEVARHTARMKALLETIQAAGFEDFDALTTSYYTSTFDKNSAPDAAQKTSRSRRLRGVLASIQESSADWTLWEARGYRDKIVDAAESIYVAELSRLSKRRRGSAGPTLTELEESLGLSDSSPGSSGSPGTTRGGDREDLLRPSEEVLRVYQNRLPNLWALLTELAGARGNQGERAALMAAAVLYNARRNPELDPADVLQGASAALTS